MTHAPLFAVSFVFLGVEFVRTSGPVEGRAIYTAADGSRVSAGPEATSIRRESPEAGDLRNVRDFLAQPSDLPPVVAGWDAQD